MNVEMVQQLKHDAAELLDYWDALLAHMNLPVTQRCSDAEHTANIMRVFARLGLAESPDAIVGALMIAYQTFGVSMYWCRSLAERSDSGGLLDLMQSALSVSDDMRSLLTLIP